MTFKEDKHYRQFWDKKVHPMLWLFLIWLDNYSQRITGSEIIITCLNRTPAENEKVGGMHKSAHLDGRAADLRSWIYKPEQIKLLEYEIGRVYGKIVHFKYHKGGTGPHIHVNINYEYAYGFN